MPERIADRQAAPTCPASTRVARFRAGLRRWGSTQTIHFPWRRSANKFHALVAEVMLQRTRANQVKQVYETFCSSFPTAHSAALAPTEKLRKVLKPLGLPHRIPQVRRLAQYIARNGGKIPADHKSLTSLPAVGEYVATAFLLFHGRTSGRPLVDANVVRLYSRYFGLPLHTVETRRSTSFRAQASRIQGPRFRSVDGYTTLDFCRMVCTSTPRCSECILRLSCVYGRRTNSAGGH